MRSSLWVLLFIVVRMTQSKLQGSYYEILQVSKRASKRELKSGYRKQALKWHPDKNSAPEAQENFAQIAEAYEVLSDDSNRRQYDLGGRYHADGGMGTQMKRRQFRNANDLFRDSFGDVHRRWRPGMTISGTFTRGGKTVRIKIDENGNSEETVEDAPSKRGGYSYMKQTSADGSVHVQYNLNDIGLASLLIDNYPIIAYIIPPFLLTLALHPCVLCGGCCYFCCCRSSRKRRTQQEDKPLEKKGD